MAPIASLLKKQSVQLINKYQFDHAGIFGFKLNYDFREGPTIPVRAQWEKLWWRVAMRPKQIGRSEQVEQVMGHGGGAARGGPGRRSPPPHLPRPGPALEMGGVPNWRGLS